MDADVRRAILEEIAAVRHLRDCDKLAEQIASANSAQAYYRHRAEGRTQTIRSLREVLDRIRRMERQRARDWLES